MNAPTNVRLAEFTAAFLALGALLLWALWQPEFGGDLALGRTRLTIWAASILLAPALVFYLFRSLGRGTANLAALFWTAAWVAFAVHAWFAVFVIFDGVADTFAGQGRVIAGGNFLLLGLWTLDVVLLWLLPERLQPVPLQVAIRLLAFAIFAFTLAVLRGGPAQMLGFVFITAVLIAALVRLGTHVSASARMEAAS